ncbi:MAG TPA: N-acetyltransferase [Nitrospirae bacterium]|nr:N-acetyltransferase [Nitrospirota bacterium]
MISKARVFKPSIRKAGFGDLEAIHALDQRLFPPGVRFDIDLFYFHLLDPASTIFIAGEKDFIGGFVIFERLSPRTGTIVTIDVTPQLQGRGIGAKLMSAVDKLAGRYDLRWIILQVSTANLLAKEFYVKQGYVTTRLLKGYYQGREDAWEMKRRLIN